MTTIARSHDLDQDIQPKVTRHALNGHAVKVEHLTSRCLLVTDTGEAAYVGQFRRMADVRAYFKEMA